MFFDDGLKRVYYYNIIHSGEVSRDASIDNDD